MISHRYSEQFKNKLQEKLMMDQDKEPKRPVCMSLMHKKYNGQTLNLADLDKQTLEELCVRELCSDSMIGALFNTPNRVIKELRNSMGYTDDRIIALHKIYVVSVKAKEVEDELGELAFE